MSDYPMLISNKLHSFRNFIEQNYNRLFSALPAPVPLYLLFAVLKL